MRAEPFLEPGDQLCYCRSMPRPPDTLDTRQVALFLDVDGTLLEIRDDPADVVADDGLIHVLDACSAALGGAMCLVSGRSIVEVDRIFAPRAFPVAGAHGAELRFNGGGTVTVASVPLPAYIVETLENFADSNDGLLLERKPGGVSLHYRRAPELESECRALVDSVMADLDDDFRLIAGKMVLEIAPSAHNKGAAIRTFLEQPPFAGRAPVFLGDDVTDEDGFRAVNAAEGASIRVGDPGQSVAEFQLPDVAAVRPWLRNAILGEKP